jgi:hypothetical protein
MRRIVESARFTRELKAIQPNPRHADELMDAVKWTLARNPKRGTHSPMTGVWMIAADDWPFTGVDDEIPPGLVVFYSFNEEEVVLESVIVADPMN